MDISIPPATTAHIAHTNGGPPYCQATGENLFIITPDIYRQLDHFQLESVCAFCEVHQIVVDLRPKGIVRIETPLEKGAKERLCQLVQAARKLPKHPVLVREQDVTKQGKPPEDE